MTSEQKIEQDSCDLIWKHLGIKGSKFKALGDDGFPDRIFWCPGGTPFIVEFKVPGESPRPKQQEIIDTLKSLGYHVEVHTNKIDTLEAIITFLESKELRKESSQILARARRWCVVSRSRTG